MSDFDYKKEINLLLSSGRDINTIFDKIMQGAGDHYNAPTHTIQDMRLRNSNRGKGQFWELFCKDWLITSGKYINVWLLNEVPPDILLAFCLKKPTVEPPPSLSESNVHDVRTVKKAHSQSTPDNGIDIVAQTSTGYIAIQCKFRSKEKSVDWKSLSTFVGLCALAGRIPGSPQWEKHIVMTNCKSVTRKIARGPKDTSICHGTFAGTQREHWMKIAGTYNPRRLDDSPIESSPSTQLTRIPCMPIVAEPIKFPIIPQLTPVTNLILVNMNTGTTINPTILVPQAKIPNKPLTTEQMREVRLKRFQS